MAGIKKEVWYSGGLRFECTQCGDCCSGAEGYVWVNQEEINGMAARIGMTPADFEAMLALTPEVVLLGTGSRQRFAHPRLHACLSAARIGLECMDTGAACRTYNILMAEGRRVLAALIPPAD